MGIFRLYSGEDGESHMEELDLTSHPELTALHGAKGVVFRSTPPGSLSDWHTAPRRQYIITLSGEAEIGLGDGTIHRLEPGEGPAGPTRAALRAYDAPSRDCLTGGGGHVKPPAVLGRWRERGDRLPSPRAPARRLRPRQASQDPATLPRQDSRPPPGAAGRARGGAPRTRRAGTPSRPRPRGSLGGR